jgi:hypothetical protein
MSRRARARRHHPRHAATNAVEIAINRARKLAAQDVARQNAIVRQAVAEFCCGQHCAQHWRSLADTANISETLAHMGLGAGADALRVINAAQQALHDVHQRHATRGTWTLYADEIDALQWLAQLHLVQLSACSYGEFSDAFHTTANRLQQARAGNAAHGAIVVVGDMPTTAEAQAAA